MRGGGGAVGMLTNLMAKVMIKLLWELLTVDNQSAEETLARLGLSTAGLTAEVAVHRLSMFSGKDK